MNTTSQVTDQVSESQQAATRPSPAASVRGITLIFSVLVFLGAFALRLFQLGEWSVWYDESVSIWLASLDPANIIPRTAIDIHPPGYYLLLGAWQNLTGRSEYTFSYFSLVCGMLLVALTCRFARMLYRRSRLVAPLAALFMAASPFQVWYSQEVRMYTIGAALALLSVMFAWRFLERTYPCAQPECERKARPFYRDLDLIGYALATAAGMYTLYYIGFLIAALNLFMLAALWIRSLPALRLNNMKRWIIAQFAALILYLPWLPIAAQQAIWPAVPSWRTFVGWQETLTTTWQVYVLGQSVQLDQVAIFLLAAAVVYLCGILPVLAGGRRFGQDWTRGLLLLIYAWGPVAIIHLLSYLTPLYFKRYMFIYSPAVPLTLAVAIAAVAGGAQQAVARNATRMKAAVLPVLSKATAVLLSLILLVAFAYSNGQYFFNPIYQMDDLRGAMHYLDERVRPGDAILLDAGYSYPMLLYYYRGPVAWRGRLNAYVNEQIHIPTGAMPQAIVLQAGSITSDQRLGGGNPYSDFYPMSEAEVDHDLSTLSQEHSRVWLVRIYDTVTDPQGYIRDWLAHHWMLASDQVFAGEAFTRVQLYLTGYTPPPGSTANIDLGTKLTYLGYDLNTRSIPAGGDIYPALTWRVHAPIPEGVRVYLRLVGPDGYQWVYEDHTPLGEAAPSQNWQSGQTLRDVQTLHIPAGTPPGSYSLQAGFYLKSNGDRLNRQDTGSPDLDLGKIQITLPQAPPDLEAAIKGLDTPLAQPVVMGSAELLGAQLGLRDSYKPGDTVSAELLWASRETGEAAAPQTGIRLRGPHEVLTETLGIPARGMRGSWTPGELIRDPHGLTIPPDAESGKYTLEALLQGSQGIIAERLSEIAIAGPERQFAPPAVQVEQRALFKTNAGIPLISLYGYSLDRTDIKAGENVNLTLVWHAEAKIAASYKVTVQLLGPDGKPAAQRDDFPLHGERLTSGWLPGEYLSDSYTLALKPDLPAGQYTLIVAFYDPATPGLQRLNTDEPDRKITLNQKLTVIR